jgi:hypothetical protein
LIYILQKCKKSFHQPSQNKYKKLTKCFFLKFDIGQKVSVKVSFMVGLVLQNASNEVDCTSAIAKSCCNDGPSHLILRGVHAMPKSSIFLRAAFSNGTLS